VDFFDIKVEDVISTIAPSLAVNQCVFSGQYCNLINRAPRSGALWVNGGFVTATNQNLGSLKTSGVDLAVNYNYNLGKWGGLGVNFLGTWVDKLETEPIPGLGSYDCAGLYGATCGTPIPQWRHKLRFVWSSPYALDAAVTWRHMDSVSLDTDSSNPLLNGPFIGTRPKGEELGARDYMDIAFTWNFWKQASLRFGVNNVFDRDPPLCDGTNVCGPAFGNGNTYPQVYDSLGRKFFTGVTVNF
jgi:outer membrane receptor protein involved in Fe transport